MSDAKASHIRAEPFLKASDFVEEESPQTKWTTERLATAMIHGFNAVGNRFDTVDLELSSLATRTPALEQDARWKVWAVKFAKLAGPALVGAIAARFPDAAKVIGALLQAVAAP